MTFFAPSRREQRLLNCSPEQHGERQQRMMPCFKEVFPLRSTSSHRSLVLTTRTTPLPSTYPHLGILLHCTPHPSPIIHTHSCVCLCTRPSPTTNDIVKNLPPTLPNLVMTA